VPALAGVEPRLAPRSAPSARSVPDASFFQFIGDLLFASGPNDRDLVRRSWHSIQRERRGKRLLLDIARSEDRDLVWTDRETRNFVLWYLLSKRRAGEHRDDTDSRERHFRSEQIHFFLHNSVAHVSAYILHRTTSVLWHVNHDIVN
jgi:hypothetical protein